MILRRLTENLKEQNWIAIWIEFVLLVAGVFLGIQVSNWNEERVARAQERSDLIQLRAEIFNNRRMLEYQVRYVERVVAGGRSSLRFLAEGEDCVDDCEALLVDFFHASQVWGTGYSVAKYQESERLGFPTDASAALAVRNFYQYIRGWDLINVSPPAYRERVRGYFPPEISAALWSGCYKLEGGDREVLTDDCLPLLRKLDVRPTLHSIRNDAMLTNQLQFWAGQNIVALQTYPPILARADAAIAAIDLDLGAGG
ncbi:hypothetical protein [Dokdonella sp.]|uniref:hypothetical protein n=1 Tax=Dokdonella sp. TaxID=2291710 RepID=UPI003C4AC68E